MSFVLPKASKNQQISLGWKTDTTMLKSLVDQRGDKENKQGFI
jgi:hypothetical protein